MSKTIRAMALALAVSVTGLATTGCETLQSGSNPFSTSDLNRLPAEMAWTSLEERASQVGLANSLVGGRMSGLAQALETSKREAMAASRQAGTPAEALDKIVDDVSAYLVAEIPKVRQISSSEWRLTMAVGEFEDQTPDRRLTTALQEVAVKLQRNAQFTKHFKLVRSSAREANAILKEVTGQSSIDTVDPVTGKSAGSSTHPEDLYILTGKSNVLVEQDGRELETTTIIELWHPFSNEIVLSQSFERKYHFHPGDRAYITDQENERRRASYLASRATK